VERALDGRRARTQLGVTEVELPFSLSLVLLFDGLRLDNTSEYRHVTERWWNDEFDELFGGNVSFCSKVV
jgi:hypothetical protein